MDLIGLIPSAGRAVRLPFLPCSKEIFPIGTFSHTDGNQTVMYPKPIISYLLDRLSAAGVDNSIIITSKQKSDILRLIGDGNIFGMNISYLVQEDARGMAHALNLAYPWVKNSVILFGMPDTVFFPENAFVSLLAKFNSSKADLTLGLFPTSKPYKFGMVEFGSSGTFICTVDKPKTTSLTYMWGIACWRNEFTNFMSNYIRNKSTETELVLGEVFQAAHDSGLFVNVLPFNTGEYFDIGTPEDLQDTITKLTISQL